jgi:hypothetical protein
VEQVVGQPCGNRVQRLPLPASRNMNRNLQRSVCYGSAVRDRFRRNRKRRSYR